MFYRSTCRSCSLGNGNAGNLHLFHSIGSFSSIVGKADCILMLHFRLHVNFLIIPIRNSASSRIIKSHSHIASRTSSVIGLELNSAGD